MDPARTRAPRRRSPGARAALLVVLAGCHRGPPPRVTEASSPAPSREGSTTDPDLPDRIGGFTADPPTTDGTAVHRTYVRGATRIAVTLARFPMSDEQYRGWVRASREGFPQAALDVPDGAGNGFYQCAEGGRPGCDLLIQLRSGVHVEIRGGGTSSREDVDTIARALPLRAGTRALNPAARPRSLAPMGISR
jgi:hypothetical protein